MEDVDRHAREFTAAIEKEKKKTGGGSKDGEREGPLSSQPR